MMTVPLPPCSIVPFIIDGNFLSPLSPPPKHFVHCSSLLSKSLAMMCGQEQPRDVSHFSLHVGSLYFLWPFVTALIYLQQVISFNYHPFLFMPTISTRGGDGNFIMLFCRSTLVLPFAWPIVSGANEMTEKMLVYYVHLIEVKSNMNKGKRKKCSSCGTYST